MFIMNLTLYFKGYPVKVKLERAEYAAFFGDDSPISLIQYDHKTDIVSADERATDSYASHAALHECICCGRYKHLATELVDPLDRCAEIDKEIAMAMSPEGRTAYIRQRIEMFKFLIANHLNPSMEDSFRRSIKILSEEFPDAT
jgi:hypothetical protein